MVASLPKLLFDRHRFSNRPTSAAALYWRDRATRSLKPNAIQAESDLCYTSCMHIDERNRLRAEASLPLLDVASETARLQKVQAEALFEVEWQRRRPAFADWIGSGQGWIAKMGRWSIARQQVRREMREAQGSPGSHR